MYVLVVLSHAAPQYHESGNKFRLIEPSSGLIVQELSTKR